MPSHTPLSSQCLILFHAMLIIATLMGNIDVSNADRKANYSL